MAFGKYGRVSDVRIVKDNVSGEPRCARARPRRRRRRRGGGVTAGVGRRGYAFITFAEQADAVDAQKAMDGSDGAGRVLKVSFARVQTQPRAASSCVGAGAAALAGCRMLGAVGGECRFAPPGGYGGGRDRDYDRRRSSRDRSRSRDRDRRRSRSRDRRRSRSRDRHDRDRR